MLVSASEPYRMLADATRYLAKIDQRKKDLTQENPGPLVVNNNDVDDDDWWRENTYMRKKC